MLTATGFKTYMTTDLKVVAVQAGVDIINSSDGELINEGE